MPHGAAGETTQAAESGSAALKPVTLVVTLAPFVQNDEAVCARWCAAADRLRHVLRGGVHSVLEAIHVSSEKELQCSHHDDVGPFVAPSTGGMVVSAAGLDAVTSVNLGRLCIPRPAKEVKRTGLEPLGF
jgi:hypothetical protein